MTRIIRISLVMTILNIALPGILYAAGAIAINYTPPNRAFGFSVGQASGDIAKEKAISQCGSGCGAEVFAQGCGALAYGTAKDSPTNAKIVGKGFGDTNEQSSKRALAECEMNSGLQCKIMASGCN